MTVRIRKRRPACAARLRQKIVNEFDKREKGGDLVVPRDRNFTTKNMMSSEL